MYDNLPDWFIVFDIWNGKNYLNRRDKEVFCEKYGFELIHLIYEGDLLLNQIPSIFPRYGGQQTSTPLLWWANLNTNSINFFITLWRMMPTLAPSIFSSTITWPLSKSLASALDKVYLPIAVRLSGNPRSL
jgi:hypothetical protein